jgi:hypothetical protein
MGDGAELNTKGLDTLIRTLAGKPSKIRIGIFGPHASREGGGDNNPTIGAKHEFGEDGMPIRSFLRMPLTTEFKKRLEASGAFTPEAFQDVIREGSLDLYLNKMGIVALQTVLEAFDTGGFGRWPAWQTPGYTNNTGQLLVDTQQLRNSIDWELVK